MQNLFEVVGTRSPITSEANQRKPIGILLSGTLERIFLKH